MSARFLIATQITSYAGLRPEASHKLSSAKASVQWQARRRVSNGSRVHCMKTWDPINNKRYEVLSYLPPLSAESIAKEVDYMISKGWIPCLEFDEDFPVLDLHPRSSDGIRSPQADSIENYEEFVEVGKIHRSSSNIPGYYDGRYWTLWKLPMFGCTDSSQVLHEIDECKKAYPDAYIRLLSFDNVRQCQCMSFVIQKPT